MTNQELAREWAATLRGAAGVIWRNLPFDGEQEVRLHRENAETIAALLDRLAEGGAVKPVQQPHACPVCGGSGQVFDRYAVTTSATVACSPCQGTGILWR